MAIQHKHPFVLKIAPEGRAHILTGVRPVGIHLRVQMLVGFAPPGVIFDVGREGIDAVMDGLLQQHGAVLIAVFIDISHDRQQRDDGDNKQHCQQGKHQQQGALDKAGGSSRLKVRAAYVIGDKKFIHYLPTLSGISVFRLELVSTCSGGA